MDTLTPKRRASRTSTQNIPATETPAGKPPTGWEFVRNRLGRESKRGKQKGKQQVNVDQVEPVPAAQFVLPPRSPYVYEQNGKEK